MGDGGAEAGSDKIREEGRREMHDFGVQRDLDSLTFEVLRDNDNG